MKLKMTACIDAPKEKVWKVLADITNVNLWVDPILSASCDSESDSGIGTMRTCNLKGNMIVKEKWVEWNEGTSFTYEAYGAPLLESASNKWSIVCENGKSLLTTESEVIIKGGVFGKLLEPLMYLISKRMGSDSLAAIKYLIETGRPYEGKSSRLPRAPIAC